MFAMFAVGAAGVVDGFAAGLYIGHRWTKERLKKKVIEAEKSAVITIQEVADEAKREVAPAIPSYNAQGAVVPLAIVRPSDLQSVIKQRSEEGKPK